MKLSFLPLIMLLPIVGCSAIEEQNITMDSVKEAPVVVYKDAQKKQCAPGGIELATMEQELTAAGVEVLCSSRENDGKMYAQACGMDEGTINVFKVAAKDFSKANDLGFSLITDLDVAVKSLKCK